MLEIPRKLRIGAHEYEIVLRDDLEEQRFFGTCRTTKLKIFIDSTVAKTQQEETMFHEALHAIFAQLGIFRDGEDAEEEKMAQSVGHSIYQFLKDNDMLR